jgi:periplasmic mercuric ion binding protein
MRTFVILIAFSTLFSCSKVASKEAEFYVRGNCGMCQERIEATATSVKGVVSAKWDEKSSNIKVVFDSTLVKEMDIHQAIASTGHSTKLVEMNTKAHDELPDCCKVGGH